MKYLVVSFVLFFCTLPTFSQQEYFIYLQTENKQAFYIRINNNVYSSTSSGYLILSKLPDSTAIVTIGFAKNVFPEQQFNIPVNHKDAGWLVKNFGDKGWGLFNLQTLAVIMNSNPAEEKKSPEINSSRKNDAFSLLLANAVNDTAVLYAVNKPKKPAPVMVADEEKKKDSISLAREELQKKDSAALVKNLPEQKDSAIIAKNTTKPKKDTIPSAKTHLTAKERAAAAKDRKVVHDTVSIVKNKVPPAITPGIPKNANAKTKAPATVKNVSGQRKDTIIIIKDSVSEKNKLAAKNKEVRKEKMPAADIKKDTVAAMVKNDEIAIPAGTKKDSVVTIPERRSRPLITKAAELLTDTSYVAVFVDESKDKFDTIRISIPFDEVIAYAKQEKPVVKETKPADSITRNKIIKDSTPVIVTEQPAPAVIKKDTDRAVIPKQSVPAPVKNDTVTIAPADSGRLVKAPSQPLISNSDCKEIAWDSDIDKLRIKMLLVVTDEERIGLAKKVFKQKCFLVKQVKALSELFKNDEGKYKWFDAVYPFVSDSGNFSSLAELIKDGYYLNRFKAMLRN